MQAHLPPWTGLIFSRKLLISERPEEGTGTCVFVPVRSFISNPMQHGVRLGSSHEFTVDLLQDRGLPRDIFTRRAEAFVAA